VHDNKWAARHATLQGELINPDLEHYLIVLDKKRDSMARFHALAQWRETGRPGPACLDAIWRELRQFMARQRTREMISLIRAGSIDGWDKLIAA